MTKDEALKLALNVLINRVDANHEAITAIREALAQPEQEPVAWMWLLDGEVWDLCSTKDRFTPMREGHVQVPLYTTPPHRKPLTDEEIDKLPWEPHEGNPMTFAEGLRYFARAIEAAHGIKETE
jgi:hypothetical protein